MSFIGSYKARDFNLSALNGISDQTLEMHFKLYQGYVKETNTLSEKIAEFINIFGWQGKVFDAKAGLLRNHILAIGLKAIIARVYKGPSLIDNKECIVLDYSETSLVASHVRDEIRQIEPGFYLGKVYWDKKRLIDFSLDFRK